jgi:hypothetical protein
LEDQELLVKEIVEVMVLWHGIGVAVPVVVVVLGKQVRMAAIVPVAVRVVMEYYGMEITMVVEVEVEKLMVAMLEQVAWAEEVMRLSIVPVKME